MNVASAVFSSYIPLATSRFFIDIDCGFGKVSDFTDFTCFNYSYNNDLYIIRNGNSRTKVI